MKIQHFFDDRTWTLSYVVHDGASAVVIDPLRDYDHASGRTSWASAERIASYLDRAKLRVEYVIDTHAHADHMTGLPFFKSRYGARSVTGARMGEVQAKFRDFYDLGPDFPVDASQFDVLVEDGDKLGFGDLEIEVIDTPGHTPAHTSLKVRDAVFVGDTLFAPDYGSARTDFPGGSAEDLYDSIQKLYAMPDATPLYLCHDYLPGGRSLQYETTVAEQKRRNVQINAATTRSEYKAFREKRDSELAAPALILPSLQVNIRAGELPEPAADGNAYLKIPLNRLGGGSK